MKSFTILLFSMATMGLTACGNIASQPDQFAHLPSGEVQNSAYTAESSQAEHACGASPNILGSDRTFANEYRACANGGAVGNITLIPSDDSHLRSVCVFPIRVSGNGQTSAVISNPANPVSTRYVYQCMSLPATGGHVSFRGLNFNALYVVNSAQAAAFSQCITYGDVSGCAEANGISASFGEI